MSRNLKRPETEYPSSTQKAIKYVACHMTIFLRCRLKKVFTCNGHTANLIASINKARHTTRTYNQASPIDVACSRVASDNTTKGRREERAKTPNRSGAQAHRIGLPFSVRPTSPADGLALGTCTFWTASSAKSLSPAHCPTIWGLWSLQIARFASSTSPVWGHARDSPTTCLVNPRLRASRG